MFSSVFYEFSLLNIAIIALVFLYVPMPFCIFTGFSLFIFAIACRLCAYISLTTFTSWYFRRRDCGFAFGAAFTAAIFCFYQLVVAFKTSMLCVKDGYSRGTFVSCIRACRVRFDCFSVIAVKYRPKPHCLVCFTSNKLSTYQQCVFSVFRFENIFIDFFSAKRLTS